MKKQDLCALAVVVCLGAGGSGVWAAGAPKRMSQQDYRQAGDRIDAQYRADRKYCASLQVKPQLADVCQAEARGKADAAKAELEARYRPSPDATLKAKNAVAEANYDVARKKCDAGRAQAKDRCVA